MPTRIRQLLPYLMIALFVAIFLVLLALNYLAAILFLLGCILAFAARAVLPFLPVTIESARTWIRRHWVLTTALVASVSVLAIIGYIVSSGQQVSCDTCALPLMQNYHVVIKPDPSTDNTFLVKQTLSNPRIDALNTRADLVIDIPEVRVPAASTGLLLKQAAPLTTESTIVEGSIILQNPDGSRVPARLCIEDCTKTTVDLRDVPKGSFYAARGGLDVTRLPYIDSEEITWSMNHLDEGIVFAYIPSPFQYLRPILEPFIGTTSISAWLIGLVGLVGTGLGAHFVAPLGRRLLARLGLGGTETSTTVGGTTIQVTGDYYSVGGDLVEGNKTIQGNEYNAQDDLNVTKVPHETPGSAPPAAPQDSSAGTKSK